MPDERAKSLLELFAEARRLREQAKQLSQRAKDLSQQVKQVVYPSTTAPEAQKHSSEASGPPANPR